MKMLYEARNVHGILILQIVCLLHTNSQILRSTENGCEISFEKVYQINNILLIIFSGM